MEKKYSGGEKVKILKGEYKGKTGYVRMETFYGELKVILDNGIKIHVKKEDVEIIKLNYFS